MKPTLQFIPPVIGHRGASAYAPENTLASFTKAMQLGIKWVEFDVMLSADGVPVVFHDDELDRTTNAKGPLHQYTYPELASLDAGAWFNSLFSSERIPTLQAVLEFLKNANMSANVELKALPGQEERLVQRMLTIMQPYLAASHNTYLFSSFSMQALVVLRRYLPNSLIGILLHEWDERWIEHCEQLRCVSVHVNHDILTKEFAHEIKSLGKYLLSYTINDPRQAKTLFSWGVDAVFSDAPDKILALSGNPAYSTP